MNKEKKCISKRLALELQRVANKFKFKLPESEYKWSDDGAMDKGYKFNECDWKLVKTNYDVDTLYKAYDTSELGEMLPDQTICRKDYIHTTKHFIYSVNVAGIEIDEIFFDNTEANARVKILIYLIKHKLI